MQFRHLVTVIFRCSTIASLGFPQGSGWLSNERKNAATVRVDSGCACRTSRDWKPLLALRLDFVFIAFFSLASAPALFSFSRNIQFLHFISVSFGILPPPMNHHFPPGIPHESNQRRLRDFLCAPGYFAPRCRLHGDGRFALQREDVDNAKQVFSGPGE